jgi:hypothetical protein
MAVVRALRVTRRDIAVVFLTAVARFAVAIPLTSASTDTGKAEVTIQPGGSVRFANLDWNCDYVRPGHNKVGIWKAQVDCSRESTRRGLQTSVDGDFVTVTKCDGDEFASCHSVFLKPRTP